MSFPGGATPEEVHAARFTAGVFPTLGVPPILGRVFTQQEEDAHQPLAVISYALWLNRYHRDPHVLGSTIDLDRRPYTIIGVMPRSFEFPLEDGQLDQAQLWVPMSLTPDELADQNAGFWGYQMVARLKDGVTFSQAAQDADRVAQQVMRSFPANMSAIHIQGDVTLLLEYAVADVRPLLRTLFFAVVYCPADCLRQCCRIVAGPGHPPAPRVCRSTGSGRALQRDHSRICLRRPVAQLRRRRAGSGVCRDRYPHRVAPAARVHAARRLYLHGRKRRRLRFASCLCHRRVCSLAPAFAALRTNLTESLKEGVRTGTGASSHAWLRSTLVVSEIAIALVLLTMSGAFLRSFQKMRAVDPGFRPDNVLVAGYQLPLKQYPTHASADAFNQAVVDRLASKPGIAAAGITNILPASGLYGGAAYTIEGAPEDSWKLQIRHVRDYLWRLFPRHGHPAA